jgi:hypothetical protein
VQDFFLSFLSFARFAAEKEYFITALYAPFAEQQT